MLDKPEVELDLGRTARTVRTADQTAHVLFWTDPEIRQWNDG